MGLWKKGVLETLTRNLYGNLNVLGQHRKASWAKHLVKIFYNKRSGLVISAQDLFTAANDKPKW